jgi:hypothetical protein
MRFVLDVDLTAVAASPAEELGRILRYWGGSMKQLDLRPGLQQDVYDSAYTKVGAWRLEE